MVTHDNTCAYFIELVLKRGGRWRNKQIEEAILRDYGVQYQSNTIAKYLSFFINDGKVLSAPVHLESGKVCDEYWLIAIVNEKKISSEVAFPVDNMFLAERCLKIAAEYPEGHPQRAAIMQQHEGLTARKRRAA